ncbi:MULTISPECIES: TrkH family potassium uptake protein [Anaerotruncus]|uniref:TrkH family potassium uptake protein n=1 Tax=Anaerotruncus TaxID=244127 RepID=UPI0008300567|nr:MULTISPECIES: TrkH family potassium uptake protein [Anaerotruncus]RGX53597.1 TrkH family potassium uptake protein [Anaerotruncus sp. AF02-27]
MNFRMIYYLIGNILRLEAAFMLPALAISFAHHEKASFWAFFGSVVFLLAISLPARKPQKTAFYAQEGFLVVGLAWIVISLLGSLPFYLSGAIPGLANCIFEGISGFSTTGASILQDIESLPMGILYWRSFSHWLGGVGVLIFVLAILPMAKGSGHSMHLLRAEGPGPRAHKILPRMHESAKKIYGIYIFFTLLLMVLLLVGGMPVFDAVTTAFSTAGTGGFHIKNDSMISYSPFLQGTVTFFMALFGVNFYVLHLILLRQFSKAFANEEFRVYLLVLLSATMIISANVLYHQGGNLLNTLHHVAFQVASVITGTGFATLDYNYWPELSKWILVVLMMLGASAGSTCCGIKISRAVIFSKAAGCGISKMLRPRLVRLVRMDGEVVDDQVVNGVFTFLTYYALITILSVVLVSLDNFSFETTVTAVLACFNNVGPGLGMVGPVGNYHAFSDFSKLVLSADMLIGRLEIFPMLMLFMPSAWKR